MEAKRYYRGIIAVILNYCIIGIELLQNLICMSSTKTLYICKEVLTHGAFTKMCPVSGSGGYPKWGSRFPSWILHPWGFID